MEDKELKRVLGFANDNPNIVGDIGNELVKMGTDKPIAGGNNPLGLVYFNHAVAEINEARYLDLCHYYKGKDAFHLIKWDSRYFVVGEQAYSVNSGFEPIRGRAKYRKEYYGILFLSGLLRLYSGKLPEAVNAFLAHPPADLDYSESLMRSVAGTWVFESNGKKHRVKVEYVNVYDEIVGGIMNMTLGVDGGVMKEVQILGGGPTLVFDMGGGSLDLARLRKDGSVDYDKEMISERIGVASAIAEFKSLFDRKYSDDLSDAEDGISRQDIIEIFLDDDHSYRSFGQPIGCLDMFQMASAPIIRQAKDTVAQFARGLMGYNAILLTGGGSGLFYKEICEQVFPRHSKNGVVYCTDLRKDMLKANAKGGLKMLEGLKQESRKLARSLNRK